MGNDGFQVRSLGSHGEELPRATSGSGSGVPFRRRPRRVRPEGGKGGLLAIPGRVVRWLIEEKRRLGWKMFLLRAFGAFIGLMILYVLFLWFTLPNLDDPASLRASQSTIITDRNGVELYRLYADQDRTYVPGEQIAKTMRDAIVAIEDERFYDRGCVDVRALARAVLNFGGRGGASTLTRQLARNALNLQQENLVSRKIKEVLLGCQMEGKYNKEKILELYLNWIPFGQNAYGIEQASRKYFGKSASGLTLAESSVLASLPQLPSYYSPYGRHVRTTVTDRILERIIDGRITKTTQMDDDDVSIGLIGAEVGTGSTLLYVGGRTDQVLKNMLDQGYITEEQRQEALKELQTISFKAIRESIRAPHFVLWLKDQVEQMLEGSADKTLLLQGGLTIQSTLDWQLQQAAEEAVAKHKDEIARLYGGHNIALVAVDPETREILAYVGNTDYSDDEHEGKIDMALTPRQPGSSFKPFIYAGAFLKGYGPATVVYDVPTKFGDYQPQNYEGGFWGVTSARQALGGSRNIPAIKAYFMGGEESTLLDLVERMGVPTPKATRPTEGYGPSMAIGTAETPLLEMVQGYATFANAGKAKPAIAIRKITDKRGAILPLSGNYDVDQPGQQVIDERVAYEITSILSDPSVRPGDYWRSVLTVPGTQNAAKTGTSNKCLKRDGRGNCTERKPDNVWTLGYTPTLAAGVWVGNATSEALGSTADGITVAAPIWKDFMTAAQKLLKPTATSFRVPDGIVQPQVSQLSGQLPTECTPVERRRADVFLRENAPTTPDPACVTLTVDKVTGLLASDDCPVDAREERSFFQPRSILADRWPQWEQGVQAWAKSAAVGTGSNLPLPLPPTEKCSMALTPGRDHPITVKILTPAQGGVVSYPSFQPSLKTSAGSPLREVRYEIDGKVVASVTEAPFDGPIRVPRSIQESGSHKLKVTVMDQYYNSASDDVTFTFGADAGGPRIMLTSPQDGASLAENTPVTMRADSSDTEGGVKYVEFYLDGTLLTRKPREPYELVYTQKIAPGSHVIRAVATDLAGNVASDEVQIMIGASGSGGASN